MSVKSCCSDLLSRCEFVMLLTVAFLLYKFCNCPVWCVRSTAFVNCVCASSCQIMLLFGLEVYPSYMVVGFEVDRPSALFGSAV